MPRFTKTIELMTFDELDEKAKERARDWYRSGNDFEFETEILKEDFEFVLAPLGYPTEDIRWRLSYSQGDGVAFYGRCDEEKVLRRLGFSELVGADILIKLVSINSHYNHYNSMRAQVESSEVDDATLEDIEEAINADIADVSRQLEREGYETIEAYNDDDYVDETIMVNDYTFDAQGNRMD